MKTHVATFTHPDRPDVLVHVEEATVGISIEATFAGFEGYPFVSGWTENEDMDTAIRMIEVTIGEGWTLRKEST